MISTILASVLVNLTILVYMFYSKMEKLLISVRVKKSNVDYLNITMDK